MRYSPKLYNAAFPDKPFNPDLEVLETPGNQVLAQCSFWTSRVVFVRPRIAGTAINHGYAIRGLVHELGVLMQAPTVVYCDSSSTIFVAKDATSVKRSVWLLRRAAVLRGPVAGRRLPSPLLRPWYGCPVAAFSQQRSAHSP